MDFKNLKSNPISEEEYSGVQGIQNSNHSSKKQEPSSNNFFLSSSDPDVSGVCPLNRVYREQARLIPSLSHS